MFYQTATHWKLFILWAEAEERIKRDKMTEEEYRDICIKRFGSEIYKKLQRSRVAVAGLGGLGSHIAVMLARSCVGTLHLIDFDTVDISNLNRQEYYIQDIGRPKAQCLKEKLMEINPFIHILTDNVRVTEENLKEIFQEETIVCEAFDRPEEKAMLVNEILEKLPHIQLISGSGMAGFGEANEIRTKRIFQNFYLCGDGKTDSKDGAGLMAPRVCICAGHQANQVIRLILQQEQEETEKMVKAEAAKNNW